VHLIRDFENLIHHHPEGDHMGNVIDDLTAAAGQVKEHVEQGEAWLRKTIDEHLPALEAAAAEVAKIRENPIVKLILGVELSADQEQMIADVVEKLLDVVGAAAKDIAAHLPAAPAAAEQTAAPVVAGGQPQ
jgi:hypothetical protein